MKKNMFSWQGWSAARLSFAVLLGVLGNPALAQAASPVGTWDCILSGQRAGTAYLTFINAGESTSRGTFTGIEVLVPNNPNATVVGEGRNSGGADTRGGTTTPPTPPPSGQQIFGYNGPNGPWALDNQGRIIGQFIEVSALENCVTNLFPIFTNSPFTSTDHVSITNGNPSDPSFCVTSPIGTNTVINAPMTSTNDINGTNTFGDTVCVTSVTGAFVETSTYTNSQPISQTNAFGDVICVDRPILLNPDGTYTILTTCSTFTNQTICSTFTNQTICYTNIIICQATTNAISFVGSVVPGRRLTLICTTPFGRTVYQGVPAQVLPDISGDWYGTKKQAGIVYQEFLTLSPSGFPFPNVYDVVGAGPGYRYTSNNIAVLSSRRKISFVLGMDPPLPTDQVTDIRAVTGPFNPRTVAATTKGFDQPGGTFTNPIIFKATRFAQ